MPLYAYRCTHCGYSFEKIQSFSAKPEKKCPECGGKLERPLSAPGLSFKGAGWYVNDYAAKPAKTGGAEAKKDSASQAGETKAACGGECGAACPAAPAPSASEPAASGSKN